MSFIADKQTTEDLNLLGKYKPGSVIGLFNKMKTRGGERLLEAMFRSPLQDAAAINERSSVFRWLADHPIQLLVRGEELALTEDYLASGGRGYWLGTAAGLLRLRAMQAIVNDERYGTVATGVQVLCAVLRECRNFAEKFDVERAPAVLREMMEQMKGIVLDRRIPGWMYGDGPDRLSWVRLVRMHHLFRHVLQSQLERLCQLLEQLDVYSTVAGVAAEKGFSYAHARPEEEYVLHARDLRHPCLEKGVGNAVMLNRHRNVLFLTGANMAGKSTFMKAFGINLYLAHMGFPVAAKDMVFSIKEGIYSSINVPDSLDHGYSHFYAEVRRVKTVAEEVAASKSLLVVFDELFKGTNVKDAYDATLAVTAAFSKYGNCWFIVSTHIIEVGEVLREKYSNLQFVYLPTVMEGGAARYTYQLAGGITSDRHGMLIIEKEGILELIYKKNQL